jgi:hypothetical protein
MPRWVHASERGGGDTYVFVGQASAASFAGAELAANEDLAGTVARFISVAVANEMEATESHEAQDGVVRESQDVRSETRAHVEASIGEVKADASYWEKVSTRTGPSTYRYFLRAEIRRSEIARARLMIARDRARRAGRRTVAVILVDPLLQDLEARLRAETRSLVLAREDLAAAAVDPSPRGLVEVARSLEVDAMLEARASAGDERAELRYALRDGTNGAVISSRDFSGPSSRIFELEDELFDSLSQNLEARR